MKSILAILMVAELSGCIATGKQIYPGCTVIIQRNEAKKETCMLRAQCSRPDLNQCIVDPPDDEDFGKNHPIDF